MEEMRREGNEEQRQDDEHIQQAPHIETLVCGQRPLRQLSESI